MSDFSWLVQAIELAGKCGASNLPNGVAVAEIQGRNDLPEETTSLFGC